MLARNTLIPDLSSYGQQQVRLQQAEATSGPPLSLLAEPAPQPAQETTPEEDTTNQTNENLTHEDSANVSLGSTAAPDADRAHVCLVSIKEYIDHRCELLFS